MLPMLIRGDWISNSIKRLIQASVRSNKEVVTRNICACCNKKLLIQTIHYLIGYQNDPRSYLYWAYSFRLHKGSYLSLVLLSRVNYLYCAKQKVFPNAEQLSRLYLQPEEENIVQSGKLSIQDKTKISKDIYPLDHHP